MVNDTEEVHYDRLYLFCGLQYDYPIKVMPLKRLPKNVVFINDVNDIDDCLTKMKKQKEITQKCKKNPNLLYKYIGIQIIY